MKAKLLNVTDVYLVHYFEEWGQKDNCHLRFAAKLQMFKNDFKKLAGPLLYFYTEICRSINKIC